MLPGASYQQTRSHTATGNVGRITRIRSELLNPTADGDLKCRLAKNPSCRVAISLRWQPRVLRAFLSSRDTHAPLWSTPTSRAFQFTATAHCRPGSVPAPSVTLMV